MLLNSISVCNTKTELNLQEKKNIKIGANLMVIEDILMYYVFFVAEVFDPLNDPFFVVASLVPDEEAELELMKLFN